MEKHWIVRDNEILDGVFGTEFPAVICEMIYNDGNNVQRENAKLIAASPELLEACNLAEDLLQKMLKARTDEYIEAYRGQLTDCLQNIHLALAKVEGK